MKYHLDLMNETISRVKSYLDLINETISLVLNHPPICDGIAAFPVAFDQLLSHAVMYLDDIWSSGTWLKSATR